MQIYNNGTRFVYILIINIFLKYEGIMHLSMFSPTGEGGGADVGHLIKLVLSRVGNLIGKFVPMVGRFECAE